MNLYAVYVICPLHNRPGSFVRGVLRPGPDKGSLVVLCPTCVELGRALREKSGLRLVNEPVSSPKAEAE